MSGAEMTECLRLLEAADELLIEMGENILAAHLSAVIEPLKSRIGMGVVQGIHGGAAH